MYNIIASIPLAFIGYIIYSNILFPMSESIDLMIPIIFDSDGNHNQIENSNIDLLDFFDELKIKIYELKICFLIWLVGFLLLNIYYFVMIKISKQECKSNKSDLHLSNKILPISKLASDTASDTESGLEINSEPDSNVQKYLNQIAKYFLFLQGLKNCPKMKTC